jgi:hypothetical protein
MFMTDIDMMFSNQHMLKPFIDFMVYHKNWTVGQLFKAIHDIIVNVPEFYKPIDQYLTDVSEGKYGKKDWRCMKINESYSDNIFRAYIYLWLSNKEKLFKSIKDGLVLDEDALDCLTYVEKSTFSEITSVWYSKWDWHRWEENKDKTIIPNKNDCKYITYGKPFIAKSIDVNFVRTINTVRIDDGESTKINLRKFGT